MKYAILCFTAAEMNEAGWDPDRDAEVMHRLQAVTDAFGRVAYAARLQPASSAVSVRKGRDEPVTIDGPFIESKEHFVGFYIVDCDDLAAATAFAKDLIAANPWGSGYEIRPVVHARAE